MKINVTVDRRRKKADPPQPQQYPEPQPETLSRGAIRALWVAAGLTAGLLLSWLRGGC